MGWIYLILGVIAEVSGATAMKMSQGFTRLIPSILIFIFYGLSLTLVTLSLKSIKVGVAYAVWAGLGVAIISLISIFWFKETTSLIKTIAVLMILSGVIILNISGESHYSKEQVKTIKIEEDV